MRPLRPNIIPIDQDKDGIIAERLQAELEICKSKGIPLPKVRNSIVLTRLNAVTVNDSVFILIL